MKRPRGFRRKARESPIIAGHTPRERGGQRRQGKKGSATKSDGFNWFVTTTTLAEIGSLLF